MPISWFLDAQLCAFVSESIHECPDERPENLKTQDLCAERDSVANASMDEVTGQFPVLPVSSLKS